MGIMQKNAYILKAHQSKTAFSAIENRLIAMNAANIVFVMSLLHSSGSIKFGVV